MPTKNNHTAVLIFSHTPHQEAKEKSFTQKVNTQTNRTIASHLVEHTKKLVAQTPYPSFCISTPDQKGITFGERFTHAIQSVFAKGFSQVIAIGSDCPSLTSQDIQKSAKALERGKVVLGPATDGGTYLIGLQQESFDPEAFKNISWQTSSVFRELLSLCSSQPQLDIEILSSKQDIDSAADLVKVLKSNLIAPYLQKLLAQLIKFATTSFYPISTFFLLKNLVLSLFGLRAPPSFS
ncbi:DUF2064 domain-containing protein [Flammeovirgaceae bacterium SG7u.111]|nr:DUF2064 domain-containing protein [Flammeovirgaceae bacterium SG7u.132]WPO36235.1 DUF2064 domain-containing protein [Flammeovirgaceae bacterium SG7u.111]